MTKRFEMVDAGFIPGAKKALGMKQEEFAQRTGRSAATIYNYMSTGKCPQKFKELVEEMMKQKDAGTLSQTIAALPVPYEPKKRQPRATTDKSVKLTVLVPSDKVPWASALLASLGLIVEQEH